MRTGMKWLVAGAILAAGMAGAHAADAAKPEQKQEQAAAKDDYPLDTCVISGDELGSMGDTIKYLHKDANGESREVRFCCKDCVKKFQKNPAKYLRMLDDAAAKKAEKAKAK